MEEIILVVVMAVSGGGIEILEYPQPTKEMCTSETKRLRQINGVVRGFNLDAFCITRKQSNKIENQ